MAPFIGILNLFALSSRDYYPSSLASHQENNGIEQSGTDLSRLCTLFDASPTDLLCLRTNEKGIRGVCLNKSVSENDVILRIPLLSCLVDESPQWLRQTPLSENDTFTVSVEGWVTRLTASLLEAQKNNNKTEGLQTWFDLFPTNLRQILPIHWDSNLLQKVNQCQSLELAVDSAFFARAIIFQDLSMSIKEADFGNVTESEIELCLDLVQTRSCRIESEGGAPCIRVLAPIFDMINHNPNHNVEFIREGNNLIVRAMEDIDADAEIFINYGSSTHPAWKCLFSYGFVPLSDDCYETDTAELVVDNMRFEVSPTDIPFELIQHETKVFDQTIPDEEIELTLETGQRIIDHIMDSAKNLKSVSSEKLFGEECSASLLLKDLKESNRRTLLACAGGLREFLDESNL